MAPTRDREQGFTLIELMAVLVIMAIAAVAIMQVRWKGSPNATVQSAALMLASEFRMARAQSMRTNSPTIVVVDTDAAAFGRNGNEYRLPRGIKLAAYGRDLVWLNPQKVGVRFRADGTSTGGDFALETKGRKASVVVDWMTGATRVELEP